MLLTIGYVAAVTRVVRIKMRKIKRCSDVPMEWCMLCGRRKYNNEYNFKRRCLFCREEDTVVIKLNKEKQMYALEQSPGVGEGSF